MRPPGPRGQPWAGRRRARRARGPALPRTSGSRAAGRGLPISRVAASVACLGHHLPDLALFDRGELRLAQVDGQLVDLAVEGEGHLVVLGVDLGAQVDTDVEGFVG